VLGNQVITFALDGGEWLSPSSARFIYSERASDSQRIDDWLICTWCRKETYLSLLASKALTFTMWVGGLSYPWSNLAEKTYTSCQKHKSLLLSAGHLLVVQFITILRVKFMHSLKPYSTQQIIPSRTILSDLPSQYTIALPS
jgi:hypothetical protein